MGNPPKKEENPPAGAAQEQVRSLGGTNQEPGPRGKGRPQLAFTPRVLATSSSTAKGQAAAKLQPMKFVKPGGVKDKEAVKGVAEEAKNGEALKSNADFRSMF